MDNCNFFLYLSEIQEQIACESFGIIDAMCILVTNEKALGKGISDYKISIYVFYSFFFLRHFIQLKKEKQKPPPKPNQTKKPHKHEIVQLQQQRRDVSVQFSLERNCPDMETYNCWDIRLNIVLCLMFRARKDVTTQTWIYMCD